MTCPLCGEETVFKWCCDLEGNEWAQCTLCGGQTDRPEIDDANREDIPVLVPVTRTVQLPTIPEWESRPTRIDIAAGCKHPGGPTSDWLRDLIQGVFEHADRVDIETWSFEEDAA